MEVDDKEQILCPTEREKKEREGERKRETEREQQQQQARRWCWEIVMESRERKARVEMM